MYIHIGGEISLLKKNIIGIFDIEKTSVNKSVNDYLKLLQKKGRIYYTSYEMPKAFVVTDNMVYITNVSAATIKKRFSEDKI